MGVPLLTAIYNDGCACNVGQGNRAALPLQARTYVHCGPGQAQGIAPTIYGLARRVASYMVGAMPCACPGSEDTVPLALACFFRVVSLSRFLRWDYGIPEMPWPAQRWAMSPMMGSLNSFPIKAWIMVISQTTKMPKLIREKRQDNRQNRQSSRNHHKWQ